MPSLQEVLSTLPDPRMPRGQRHPLGAILSLAVVAVLAGHKSYEAIAQFGRDHGCALAWALGFRRGKTPCKSTFSVLFRALDLDAFEAALRQWILLRCAGVEVLAIDGKTVRGSHDGEMPAVHLLSAYAPQVAAVVGQIQVDNKTNEHKAALRLLGVLPLENKIVTGDAMFCQRDLTEQILEQQGDYVLQVKDNQPTLKKDIAMAFGTPEGFSPLPTATTTTLPANRL